MRQQTSLRHAPEPESDGETIPSIDRSVPADATAREYMELAQAAFGVALECRKEVNECQAEVNECQAHLKDEVKLSGSLFALAVEDANQKAENANQKRGQRIANHMLMVSWIVVQFLSHYDIAMAIGWVLFAAGCILCAGLGR